MRLSHRGHRGFRDWLALFFLALLIVGCNSNSVETAVPPTTNLAANLALPDDFTAAVAVSGLARPTQMIWGQTAVCG
ncbi:hypothetical protein [Candidatus Leptofilum sp.]|uniref:hypothetical protein n=1 Tax=Candidatus Leptofilum sp. TaxID=3241576 RepID=UPI003B58BF2A